ncbi:MAG: phytanoyl-CoA dioxygenase family protein [Elusimicrobia bacterium]|nr:phytanoyl-CoA dioxygenase family protein [Elusimicrobiota bacterium]
MAAKLSLAQKRRFARDGYVMLPRVVPAALTGAAVREINNRLGTGAHPGKDYAADPKDYLSEYASSRAVMDLARGPVRQIAESLLGAGKVEPLTQGQVVLRFPAEHDAVEYERLIHIDGLYSSKDGLGTGAGKPLRYSLCAGVLLSDTPAPDMGNLTVFPGTHRQIARAVETRGLDALKGALEEKIPLPAPVQVTGRAGDVVLFHFQLAHDKARNLSPHIRRAAYFRFWHIDAWHDGSLEYLKRAMIDPWLEWPGMRGIGEA